MIYIEPPESERLFKEISQLGKRLKLPIPESFLELQVFDKYGKTLTHTRQRSHSWTRNAYNLLVSQLMCLRGTGGFTDGNLSIKDTAGAVSSTNYITAICAQNRLNAEDPEAAGVSYLAEAGAVNQGIIVGTGVDAESFDDFALTVCNEGVRANQLNYMAMEAPTKSWDAGTRTKTVTFQRYMNNNGVADVTIGETGIVAKIVKGASVRCLMSRDVLAVPVVIPASGQILASYAMSIVYPS